MQIESGTLLSRAQGVLATNNQGTFTVPSKTLYPHQWQWDSAFIAIGIANYDPRRAAAEVTSLFRGQWQNGMLPHITFSPGSHDWEFWQASRSGVAPTDIQTSAMIQPPLPAIAALAVADKLTGDEAQTFLKSLFPKLVAWHQWIYNERDPDGSGLAVLIHPWESGIDNSPAWMEVLRLSAKSPWVAAANKLGVAWLIGKLRKDTKLIPTAQRATDLEELRMTHRALRFRKRNYDSHTQIRKSDYVVEDLVFNSLLIAANRALLDIATIIAEDLPSALSYRFEQTQASLEQLWDESSGQYYSRHYHTKELIKQPSLATFLPLFGESVDFGKAQKLVTLLKDPARYWTNFPVPSAPLNSAYFDEQRYWQGPMWVNTNWLIVKGLLNYGFHDEAKQITQRTLEAVTRSGFHEYFSPLSGKGYGIDNFSWTAALVIDLINLKL